MHDKAVLRKDFYKYKYNHILCLIEQYDSKCFWGSLKNRLYTNNIFVNKILIRDEFI